MRSLLQTFMLSILVAVGLSVFVAAGSSLTAPSVAYADATDDICLSIGGIPGPNGCTSPTGTPDVNSTLIKVIDILSGIVGAVAVIMIIIAGFRFVTSSGDANGTKSARSTIIYAIVGLIVVAFAQSIVFFVLDKT